MSTTTQIHTAFDSTYILDLYLSCIAFPHLSLLNLCMVICKLGFSCLVKFYEVKNTIPMYICTCIRILLNQRC